MVSKTPPPNRHCERSAAISKHNLLEISNLNLNVDSTPIVKNISLTLKKGETLCVVGESGSGKTLTALAVMGLLPENIIRQASKLNFAGQNLQTLNPKQYRALRGTRISMIFQEPLSALNPVMTVGAQVAEVFKIHTKMPKKARYQATLDIFAQVQLNNGAQIYPSYPHELSGGQRQRVMIAMALAMQPDLLIADEPTTALDVTVQGEILKLIKSLQKKLNMAVLFITHDFGVVKNIADKVIVMEKGKLVEAGTPKQIMEKPKQKYTQKLIAAMPILDTEIRNQKSEKVLLEVVGLSKTYISGGGLFSKKRTVEALKNANFKLYKGQTIGVVGESASGKSTLAKCILQLEKPDNGSVTMQGQGLVGLKGKALREAWGDMQMIFQDPFASLNPRRKIGESITEGLKAHGYQNKAERTKTAKKLLKEVGLPVDSINRYPHQFSGGQRQRIGIARALALQPKLIIADEAVASLDVSIQRQVLDLMESLKNRFGLSYLFISHDLRVVSQVADYILVMKAGEIVEQGATHQVFGKPKHAYTKQLLGSLPN